jgi:hypothetical protein
MQALPPSAYQNMYRYKYKYNKPRIIRAKIRANGQWAKLNVDVAWVC